MEKFLGKWVEVKQNVDDQRKFIESMGVPKETAEKMVTNTGFIDTVQTGELFQVTTGFVEDSSLNRTYRFKLNETFSDKDNFGQQFTLVCKVEGNKWFDTCTNYYDQTIESVREVVGDTLIVTSTSKGNSLVSKFKKE